MPITATRSSRLLEELRAATLESRLEEVRRRIRELARRHVHWGRRLVYGGLRLHGWSVNHERVQQSGVSKGSSGPCHERRSADRPQVDQGAVALSISAPRLGDRLPVGPDNGWPHPQVPERDR